MDLNGKTVLLTGGSRGIGLELTRQLVARRAKVIVVGQNKYHLDAVANNYEPFVTSITADLSDTDAVDNLITKIKAEFSDLSILINNAGIQTEMAFLERGGSRLLSEGRREIAVNLGAAIALCGGFISLLEQQAEAAIVNVTSALAIAPKQASPVYSATKAGLRNFTRALRYQCSQDSPNILVSEVIMALVDTDMTRGRGKGKITPEQAASAIIEGLEADLDEIWVGKAKLLRIINRLSPALAGRILR